MIKHLSIPLFGKTPIKELIPNQDKQDVKELNCIPNIFQSASSAKVDWLI